MTYGPPLRFKAVYTETGFGIFVNYIDFQSGSFGIGVGKSFEFAKSKHKIYQSTGHTDAKGQEVFFGDVLVTPDPVPDLLTVVFFKEQIQLKRQRSGHTYPNNNEEIKRCVLIGNIHTPPAELQAAAEKAGAEHGIT